MSHAHPEPTSPARVWPCQRGLSYRCSRSDSPSQDSSPQDIYLERNAPRVLFLTHTLVALPNSQGSICTRWPSAICGRSMGIAAVAAGDPEGPTEEPARPQDSRPQALSFTQGSCCGPGAAVGTGDGRLALRSWVSRSTHLREIPGVQPEGGSRVS